MNADAATGVVTKAVLISILSPLWVSVAVGSMLFGLITLRGKGYSKGMDAFMVALHGASSVFLFLPMVLAYYKGILSPEEVAAITMVVTVVVIRFAPATFDVAEDIIHSLLPKIAEKYLGVKGDKQ